MTITYNVLTTRPELAIYYGWEYGIKRANQLLKAAKPIKDGNAFYAINTIHPLSTQAGHKLRRDAEALKKRVTSTVTAFYARKYKSLNVKTIRVEE